MDHEFVDVDKTIEEAIGMTNLFLIELRKSGYIVVDMGEMIEKTSMEFASFLFKETSWPFELRKTALPWSCSSAASLVVGLMKSKQKDEPKKPLKGLIQGRNGHEEPASDKKEKRSVTLSDQTANLGNWEEFAKDITNGAFCRLQVFNKMQETFNPSKLASIEKQKPSTKP